MGAEPEELATTEREPIKLEMTAAEGVSFAIEAMRGGRSDIAGPLLEAIAASKPDMANAVHFLGVYRAQTGDIDEAIRLMERSIAMAPDQAEWVSNLGIAYIRVDRNEEGRAKLLASIEQDPNNASTFSNLGLAERRLGNPAASEAAFKAALAIDPDHIGALSNYCWLLSKQRRLKDQAKLVEHMISLDPDLGKGGQILLARAYFEAGERGRAIDILHEVSTKYPNDAILIHNIAAMSGESVPDRASDEYVKETFDVFSDRFDSKLKQLDYRAPELVAEALDRALGATLRAKVGLDAGCGTGLVGPLIRGHFAKLDGVDLSEGMLARAAKRGCYDRLEVGELTGFIARHPEAYDAVISADTLCYFGALEAVTAATRQALKPGGAFVFTLEHCQDETGSAGFLLQYNGRYAHRESYVRRILADHAAESVAIDHVILRKEVGAPVHGLLVTARW